MPTVRPRETTRRRDRNRDDDTDTDTVIEEYEDTDADKADDDDDDGDTVEETTKTRSSSRTTSRRRPRDDDDDGDDGKRTRRSSKEKPKLPEGVRTGWGGADETLKSGGSGMWLSPGKQVDLIKFLEPAPLVSARQHWLDAESSDTGGRPMRRPYVCPGVDCPICALGNNPTATYAFNVLKLSGEGEPKVMILRLGTTGFQNLKEVSADRKTGDPDVEKDYFAVQKTADRVVFRPVKDRDLEDDWDEIFDNFDPNDIDDIIEEAKGKLYGPDVIKPTPRRELERMARYLSDQAD